MSCRKCKKDIPQDAPFCPWCGAKQTIEKPKRRRGNGTGWAFKRGRTWTAAITVGWKVDEADKKQPVQRTKGGFATKGDALAYCPTLRSTKPAQKYTFKSAYDEFIGRHEARNRSDDTIACYRAAMNHFKRLHHVDMRLITADDLQACMDACERGKRTKENMKAIAGLVFKYLIEKDVLEKDYSKFLYTGNGKKGTRPAFTSDEIEIIRKAVDKVEYADYIYFMIHTGYRPEEQFILTREHYDAKNNCLYGGIKTDAGFDKIVTISPKIRPILEKQLALGKKYLFPRKNTGGKLSPDYFRKYCFYPCMEALGIDNRVPYSARHAFSNLLKDVAGADTDKAALMGHTDIAMTKAYQSTDYASLKRITDAL